MGLISFFKCLADSRSCTNEKTICAGFLGSHLFIWETLFYYLFIGIFHVALAENTLYPEPKISWIDKQPIKKDVTKYEAEEVLVNKEKISGVREANKWFVYLEGDDKWSGDKTLQGEKIFEDRSPKALESSMLHFRIPLEKGAKYTVTANGGRTYGVSLDGENFEKARGRGYKVVENYQANENGINIYVANCYVDPSPGFTYIDFFTVEKLPARVVSPTPNPPFVGFAKTRVVEKFPRAAVAIPMQDGGVYVSWRLLKEDPQNIKFDVYRVRGGREAKLNSEPIEVTCDFTDTEGKKGDHYIVRPSEGIKGLSGEASTLLWKLDENGTPYQAIQLVDATSGAQKVGIADLNGDGVYDYIVKTPNSNSDPAEGLWKPSKDTYKLNAYLSDGTHLWTYDMGWGIECGMWYSPFITYDFDGDGKAEVALKIAEDRRDKDGRVYEGAEYLVVLDGMTGKEIDRVPWPSRDGFENYCLVSRNQLSLAYLDGKTPCVIALRGTYGTMKAEAWQLNNRKLVSCWKFSNYQTQYDEGNKENCWQVKTDKSPKYYGMGAHQSVVADLDGDGKDEIILGSFVLNGNGAPFWSLAKGHPDWVILTDIIWENAGMEIALMYESAQSKGGVCVVDAKTGKFIWQNSEPSKHVHIGYCVNFDPTLSGPELVGIDVEHDVAVPTKDKTWRWRLTNTGNVLSSGKTVSKSPSYGVYWDGDLEKEIAGSTIKDYEGGNLTKIKGNIGWCPFVADLFGDWREEIITVTAGELRIYSTTIPAMDRRPCLMQEHPYRMKVAINSQGYYYDPNLPYMPTFESNNFSLIFKPKSEGSDGTKCQVTVSASKKSSLSGTVTLTPPAGVSLDQTSWQVNLKPGEIVVKNVVISGALSKSTILKGELKESNTSRIYRGQVPIYATVLPFKIPTGNVVKLPAAKFTKSEGGTPSIVLGRALSPDGCLIGWDNAGHKITWEITVSKEENYHLLLQNSTLVDAKRRLSVNGKIIADYHFPSTGGKGDSENEWALTTLSQGDKATAFKLNAGRNEITLENIDNNMLNLAYLFLEPAE